MFDSFRSHGPKSSKSVVDVAKRSFQGLNIMANKSIQAKPLRSDVRKSYNSFIHSYCKRKENLTLNSNFLFFSFQQTNCKQWANYAGKLGRLEDFLARHQMGAEFSIGNVTFVSVEAAFKAMAKN